MNALGSSTSNLFPYWMIFILQSNELISLMVCPAQTKTPPRHPLAGLLPAPPSRAKHPAGSAIKHLLPPPPSRAKHPAAKPKHLLPGIETPPGHLAGGCPHTQDECPHCGTSGAGVHPACKYSFAVHTTAEADEFHQDSCVKNWMSRMADREGCIAYMSGISEGNPDMAACSVQDLGKICEQQAVHFRQSDAEALCAATNQAATQFWHSRARTQGAAAAGHINQRTCGSYEVE